MNDPVYARFLQKRLSRRRTLALGGSAGVGALFIACSGKAAKNSDPAPSSSSGEDAETIPLSERPEGWTETTHGKGATPDYEAVFPSDRVNQVSFTISAANWQKMLDDMVALRGARGTAGTAGGNRPPGGGVFEPGGIQPGGGGVPPGGAQPGGGMRGGGDLSQNPTWVPGDISFNGKTWKNVGIRFKGNSSLNGSWGSGTDKMPFKIDFDEFEGDFPEIADQRFYGFKQISLSNNFGDAAFMRETVAYGLLEESGLVAAATAPWELTLDYGQGPKSIGLYTAIEVIDDTVLAKFFDDDSGNIYEAEGGASSFAQGVESQLQVSFPAEGGDNPDWSDVKALYAAIHAETRLSDAAAWRKGLEAVFDVDVFLEWLAIAGAIGHWDTYGAMTHNYYLYNNPENKKLTWISWDHNFVLGASAGGGGAGPGGPAGGAAPGGVAPGGVAPGGAQRGGARGGPNMSVSLDRKDVGANWPLIRYLLDQPDYMAKYNNHMKQFAEKLFDPAKLSASYAKLADVRRPYVGADGGETAFKAALESLNTATRTRSDAVKAYLATI